MNKKTLERIPRVASVMLVILVVAACTIPLRNEERQTSTSGSADLPSDPLSTKLAECRSVTYEQKDALSECQKAWDEKRREFLGQKALAPPDGATSQAGSSLFVAPKDESRLPSGHSPIQQTGKE